MLGSWLGSNWFYFAATYEKGVFAWHLLGSSRGSTWFLTSTKTQLPQGAVIRHTPHMSVFMTDDQRCDSVPHSFKTLKF